MSLIALKEGAFQKRNFQLIFHCGNSSLSMYLKNSVAKRSHVQAVLQLRSCENLICQCKAAFGVGVKNAVTVEVSSLRSINLLREEAHVRVPFGLAHPICQFAVPVHGHGTHTHITKPNNLPRNKPKTHTISCKIGT